MVRDLDANARMTIVTRFIGGFLQNLILSSAENSFNRDYGGETDAGHQGPKMFPTYRSWNLPLLSTTRDTSFPSFIAFAAIPSAVDLTSRTCA